MTMKQRIFLVEDDEVDARTITRALRRQHIECDVIRARDGVEAIDVIRRDEEILRDCLMLLDLNMPRMGGLELLRYIREHGLMQGTPVFILTTSRLKDDRNTARELGVSGYIVKDQIEIEFENLMTSYHFMDK